jgi:hypothetical protein
LLGLWNNRQSKILLDADTLENNPRRAFSTALHELGHMLGVPHIINYNEIGRTGYIVLSPGVDATNHVMYPWVFKDNYQEILSQVEIDRAKQHLFTYWTQPERRSGTTFNCELFHIDNED